MKKFLLIILASSLLLSCAENEALTPESAPDVLKKESNIVGKASRFTFDSVINPDVWKTYQSLEEMQAACQIPEKLLKEMTTEEIVRACMTYPLALNYLAYNNEMDGIKIVMDGFNGFSELRKRADAADKLVAYYENMDVDAIAERVNAKTSRTEAIKEGMSTLHIGYAELILSSGFLPSLYKTENLSRIEKARYDKFEAKLRHTEIFGMETVSKSLLLGAQLKLNSKVSLTPEEKTELQKFVKAGGQSDTPESYTEVSKIVNR